MAGHQDISGFRANKLDFVRFLIVFGFGAEDRIHNLVCYVQASATSLNYNFSPPSVLLDLSHQQWL